MKKPTTINPKAGATGENNNAPKNPPSNHLGPNTPPEKNGEKNLGDKTQPPRPIGSDTTWGEMNLGDKNPSAAKPDNLPAKFWDSANNRLRVDDLVKSYCALEQNHGRLQAMAQKAESNSKNLAEEKAAWQKEKTNLLDQLQTASLFGGDWRGAKEKTMAWATQRLGADTATAIASRPDGLLALQKLRAAMGRATAEPPLLAGGGATGQGLDEAALRRLMKSPSYWRDRKPEILQKVEKGFATLYGDKK